MKEPSGVPRKGHSISSQDGQVVGTVSSGARSPSLEKMIGLAYISERDSRNGGKDKLKKDRGKNREDDSLFLELRGDSKAQIELIHPLFFLPGLLALLSVLKKN